MIRRAINGEAKLAMNERYIVTAVLVAGTLIASFALAEDASQKTGTHPREMMKNAEASGKPGAAERAKYV